METAGLQVLVCLNIYSVHFSLIIAGYICLTYNLECDQSQVGPRTLVLGKEAKENGLGRSVLERLHSLYHSPAFSEKAKAYSAPLLTNYRCHPGILRLPSHLFYDATLQVCHQYS